MGQPPNEPEPGAPATQIEPRNEDGPVEVFGDAAYGTGELLAQLEGCATSNLQAPVALNGIFPKDRFEIDLDSRAVKCPAGHRAKFALAPMVAGLQASARTAPPVRCAPSARRLRTGAM